jgi:hypothetical protein
MQSATARRRRVVAARFLTLSGASVSPMVARRRNRDRDGVVETTAS